MSEITIKSVQHSEFASQETNCFECKVYFNGKLIGTAENSGHGGCTDVHYTVRADREAVQEWIDTLPAVVTEMKTEGMLPFTYAQSADGIIDELIEAWLQERDVKKLLAKRVVWTKMDTDGMWQTRALKASERDHLIKSVAGGNYPKSWGAVGVVLNTLPLSEAVAIVLAQQE